MSLIELSWTAKKKVFCPKKSQFGPKIAFLFILGQALPAHLVGGCGARAVSRKTPICFILPLFLVLSKNSWFWSWVFSMNMAWPGHLGLAGPSPFFLELPPGGDNLRTKILKHPLGLWSAGRERRDNLRIHSISYSSFWRPASLSVWQNNQVQIDWVDDMRGHERAALSKSNY